MMAQLVMIALEHAVGLVTLPRPAIALPGMLFFLQIRQDLSTAGISAFDGYQITHFFQSQVTAVDGFTAAIGRALAFSGGTASAGGHALGA